ncbi:MAG TPA: methyltransferase domain-containing protein [Acidimicrobiales bacterium]|nr:methyltransferase domain-containing protein [Acidimicrobiales bacterium]
MTNEEAPARPALPIEAVPLLSCPVCVSRLQYRGVLECRRCRHTYEVIDGIPILLPPESGTLELEYRENYDRIATDDLAEPIVANRELLLHSKLLEFIGSTDGASVLDIGSAYGSHLRKLEAARKVAVDLALPYLRTIPPESVTLRVCGDAEALPVDLHAFDVVIMADILEHLLDPEKLVARLARDCRPETRIIVHIPWRESLESYKSAQYKFVHLRSFDEESFRTLFREFKVVRERSSLPIVDGPIVFRLKSKLPKRLYEQLVRTYFRTSLAHREQVSRARWSAELPNRERWLLRFYEPVCKMFELRKQPETRWWERVAGRALLRERAESDL